MTLAGIPPGGGGIEIRPHPGDGPPAGKGILRLTPVPCPEPERLAGLLDADPAVVEPGLRFVARQIPVKGTGWPIDRLALDAEGRPAILLVAPRVSGATLEAALALRSWLRANLGSLRALLPVLKGCRDEVRCLILSGTVEPGAGEILSALAHPRPEVLEAVLFESPAGLALSLRAHSGPRTAASRDAAGADVETRPATGGNGADPLSGIPLTAEEADEFRRLVTPAPPRRSEPAPRPALSWRGSYVEN